MATRQKDKDKVKDVINFSKKLKKRCSTDADSRSRERKILERVVFAIFLENAPFKTACSCYDKLERYFIDWNEARVSKANEIASVVGNVPNAFRSGDRLRRLLQWIFDKTFKFDLEDVRAKGVEETLGFLTTVPYSTRFMNEYVSLFGFGSLVLPMDEGVLRVFRLLGWVEVSDDKEIVPCLDGVFKESELKEFFFAVHELGCELMDESTQKGAIKFLATIDSEASKRSFEPLVEPRLPADPSEIAKLYAKRERPTKSLSASAMMSEMYGDGAMDSDEMEGSDDFEKDGEDGEYDPYNAENSDEFPADGLGGRRGAQEPAFSPGKRAETTLSKDGASYSESVSESTGSSEREASRSVRSERASKSRKRVKDVESEPESSQKGAKAAGSTRSIKESAPLKSKESDDAEKLGAALASDEKTPNEKKPSEKKSSKKKSCEKNSGESDDDKSEKPRSKTDDGADVKNLEVKKATRVSKSKKAADDSEPVAESTAESASKKKSVSSVRNVADKKSVDEGVKKEKKTSSKATNESENKSKTSSGVSNVESSKKRVKEQEVVDDGAAKTKRRRESESPKIDPPLTRSKKR